MWIVECDIKVNALRKALALRGGNQITNLRHYSTGYVGAILSREELAFHTEDRGGLHRFLKAVTDNLRSYNNMAGLLAQRIKRFLIEKGPVSLIYTLLLIGSLLRLADLGLFYIAAACGF